VRTLALLVATSVSRLAAATPATAAPTTPLVALAAADDARKAVVIGAHGEVYAPDGKGAWVHRLACATAGALTAAGRAGGAIIASGDGVVYRLAGNGWSAIRLVQHGKAIVGTGARTLAAVGRQLYALDSLTNGEPTKLAVAPANVVALAAGAKAIVVATDTGVFRIDGTAPPFGGAAGRGQARTSAGAKPVAIPAAPRRLRLISERWALVDRGALELTTGAVTAWPSGLTIGPAATAPDGALVAIATTHAGLELVTLGKSLARDPLALSGTAVAVTVDRAGRALVVLADGRIALRDKAGWTTTQVTDEPPAPHPGAPPATSL
jgi:hypothetical protein